MMEFAAAIGGGLLGALFGFLAQVFISVRMSDLQTISDQIEDLRRIETHCVAYWLANPSEADECRRHAAKLRGAIMASATFEEHGPRILGCRYAKYVTLTLKIDDIATGGEFESKRKDIDAYRAATCMRLVGELISHLRLCRKFVFLWR